jgi:hypothetical protein
VNSKIFKNLNWAKFDLGNPDHRKYVAAQLQAFCALPNRFVPARFAKIQEFVKDHEAIQKAQLQMFTLPSDFPVYEKAIDVVEKFHLATEYDNGYEQIFDVKDFSGTKASGFDVSDVQSGLTFNQVLPGEKVKVYQMSGTKERCYFNYYGGALGWFRGLFEDQEFWTIEDNAIEFRSKAYATRAAVFYALLGQAMLTKGCCSVVPSDCSDCESDSRSIAESLNYAARQILMNCRNKGYNLNAETTELIVLTPLALRGRVRNALAVRNQAFVDSERLVDYRFRQITTLMGGNSTQVAVILPKRKMKAGYRMDLTLFDDFDILSYTDTIAGWMRYGGCIGDLDQIECISFTDVSGSCPTSPAPGDGVDFEPQR